MDNGGCLGKACAEHVECEGGVGGATLVERGGEGVVCYGGGRRREGVND